MTTDATEVKPVEPVLELSTKRPERHHILIDGDAYFFVRLGELGLDKRRALGKAIEDMFALEGKEMTEQDANQHVDLVRKICRLILPDCPREILNKFEPYERETIVSAFLGVTVGTSSRLQMLGRLRTALSQQLSNSITEEQTPQDG